MSFFTALASKYSSLALCRYLPDFLASSKLLSMISFSSFRRLYSSLYAFSFPPDPLFKDLTYNFPVIFISFQHYAILQNFFYNINLFFAFEHAFKYLVIGYNWLYLQEFLCAE